MSRQNYSHNARQAKPAGLRLLVCGDRNWTDKSLIEHVLKEIHAETPISCVIEGECRGVDLMARDAAFILNIPVVPFHANWRSLGPQAGPIRNQRMLDEGKPDKVIAFHDHLMLSVGTADMVNRALDALGEVVLYGHADLEIVIQDSSEVRRHVYSEQILRRDRFV